MKVVTMSVVTVLWSCNSGVLCKLNITALVSNIDKEQEHEAMRRTLVKNIMMAGVTVAVCGLWSSSSRCDIGGGRCISTAVLRMVLLLLARRGRVDGAARSTG